MYVPEPYREDRREVLLAAIAERGLGTLVTHGAGGLQASQAPFLAVEAGGAVTLVAHLARANPQWREAGAEALVLFTLDDAYISPNWYPSKAATGRVVPTWNYIVVEARGALATFNDVGELRALLVALAARHEAGEARPWTVDDAPADYIGALTRGIVGVRLKVETLTGAWKLGQDKPVEDRRSVARALAAKGVGRRLTGAAPGA